MRERVRRPIAVDVPISRRLERPAWINARSVLGLALFAISLWAGQQILVSGRITTPVWRANTDLAAGTPLQASDLVAADVRLPDDLATKYAGTASDLVGLVPTRAIGAGELIPADVLAQPGVSDGMAMTIPISPEHAVGGDLRPGDTVDVYVSYNPGDIRALTKVVLDDAQVLDLVTAGGLVVGDKAVVGVTVAVDAERAKELAFAIRNGEIDLARGSVPDPGGGP